MEFIAKGIFLTLRTLVFMLHFLSCIFTGDLNSKQGRYSNGKQFGNQMGFGYRVFITMVASQMVWTIQLTSI